MTDDLYKLMKYNKVKSHMPYIRNPHQPGCHRL